MCLIAKVCFSGNASALEPTCYYHGARTGRATSGKGGEGGRSPWAERLGRPADCSPHPAACGHSGSPGCSGGRAGTASLGGGGSLKAWGGVLCSCPFLSAYRACPEAGKGGWKRKRVAMATALPAPSPLSHPCGAGWLYNVEEKLDKASQNHEWPGPPGRVHVTLLQSSAHIFVCKQQTRSCVC